MYTRDESYYFTLITIRIEDCVFRVPRHGFEEKSEVFRNMFSMPTGCELKEESEQEGGSDENPIRIDGVDKQSFKDLLTLLYPRPCDFRSPKEHLSTMRADELLAILRLAHMWEFAEIRDLVIANLECMSLPEVQKIVTAHKFGIQKWYMPAYKALVKRSGALTVAEATQLGFEFAIQLAGVRERWIVCLGPDPGDAALEADIEATFGVKPPSPQKACGTENFATKAKRRVRQSPTQTLPRSEEAEASGSR